MFFVVRLSYRRGNGFALAGLVVVFFVRAAAGGLIGHLTGTGVEGYLNLFPFRSDDTGTPGSLLVGSGHLGSFGSYGHVVFSLG